MDISPEHEAARLAAIRIPALQASLTRLVQTDPEASARSSIALYGTVRPPAGDPPGAAPIVTLKLTAGAGTIDEENHQIILTTPIEGQITGADPTQGSIPTWARILDPAGGWWADVSVSVTGGGGEIQMTPTGEEGDPAEDVVRLFNGAFARLTTAVFGG